jgi:hypothetical protein
LDEMAVAHSANLTWWLGFLDATPSHPPVTGVAVALRC